MHEINGIFNKTVANFFTILKKYLLPNMNPLSYFKFSGYS